MVFAVVVLDNDTIITATIVLEYYSTVDSCACLYCLPRMACRPLYYCVKVSQIYKRVWIQGRNHRKMLATTSAMVGRICPLGWDRVKVPENLGATGVAPVAPVVTSLNCGK